MSFVRDEGSDRLLAFDSGQLSAPPVPRSRSVGSPEPLAPREPAKARSQRRRMRRRAEWCPVTLGALLLESLVFTAAALTAAMLGQWDLMVVTSVWMAVRVISAGFTSGSRQAKYWGPLFGAVKYALVAVLALMAFWPGLFGLKSLVAMVGLASVSLVMHEATRWYRRHHREANRVFVIARPHQLRDAVHKVAAHNTIVHRSVGTAPSDSTYSGLVLASEELDTVIEDLFEFAPDRVVVFPNALNARDLQELSWAIEDYDIELALELDVDGISASRLHSTNTAGRTGLTIRPRRNMIGSSLMRLADILGASAALMIAGPIMLVLALLVRLDSKGPAIFKQERVGKNGELFTMLKFRSMHTNAEEVLRDLVASNEVEGGVLFKMKDDPRITRVGKRLRQTSLDELPQLINVLTGSMSLVGPRPALPSEVAAYDHRAMRRLAVRPGLTGLWQVSGRSNLGFDEAVRLDLDYVDNWSPGLELGIAMKTVSAVVRRDGAY